MALNPFEMFTFRYSLRHPWFFKHVVRPELYRRNHGDAEAVHEYTLRLLNDPNALTVIRSNRRLFKTPEGLQIDFGGRRMSPFGTAAGMDKNGDALEAFSYVFGFQEMGTVVVNKRDGNDKPRVAVDPKNEDLYNAQGFPCEGLNYTKSNLMNFRARRGSPVVYASICGLPLSAENAIDVAMKEMELLLKELDPYFHGFVWNPFSPNTNALKLLRTPKVFRDNSELMRKYAASKLRLVKMGPYEDDEKERKEHLDLVNAFLEGGGHGVVDVNTKSFPRDQLPFKEWGYASAGRSGRSQKPYMLRAVRDTRKAFPSAVIVATSGISSGEDAYDAFDAGATLLEGYTPYTYHGLGLKPRMERELLRKMKKIGYRSLEEIQVERRSGKSLLNRF